MSRKPVKMANYQYLEHIKKQKQGQGKTGKRAMVVSNKKLSEVLHGKGQNKKPAIGLSVVRKQKPQSSVIQNLGTRRTNPTLK